MNVHRPHPPLWRRIHSDQRGAVSLETVLIIAAIAIPILIFLIKFGWPRIEKYFMEGLDNLETESKNVQGGAGTSP
jgi:hypothetical protein